MSARDALPAFRLGRGGALVWDDRAGAAPGAAPGAPRAAEYVDVLRSLSGAAADPRARAAVCTSVDLRVRQVAEDVRLKANAVEERVVALDHQQQHARVLRQLPDLEDA